MLGPIGFLTAGASSFREMNQVVEFGFMYKILTEGNRKQLLPRELMPAPFLFRRTVSPSRLSGLISRVISIPPQVASHIPSVVSKPVSSPSDGAPMATRFTCTVLENFRLKFTDLIWRVVRRVF